MRPTCWPSAAVAAGAPDGCIQVVEEPTIPLIEALMSDPTTDVILATGGVAVVRAAYRSGNPAIGVGPGNVPALVDHTADLAAAAERLIDSKSFDNSILCTNESCVIVEERCAEAFERELGRHGAGTNMNGISNSGTSVGFTIDNNGNFHNFTVNPLRSHKARLLNINGSTTAMAFGTNSVRHGGRHRRQRQRLHPQPRQG